MTRFALIVLLTCAGALAADVSGAWTFAVQTDGGSGSPTFTFKQTGEKLTGKYSGQFGQADVAGTVKDNQIEFSFEVTGDQKLKITYKGTIETALSMKGSVDFGDFGKGTWTATKK